MPSTLEPPFFNAERLPHPSDAFVAWLDVMGARATMMRSLSVTANFVFKLHVAALEERRNSIRLYPVMDGLYVVAVTRTDLRAFLSDVFVRLANLFVRTDLNQHRFIPKCAVAYGGVIHGSDVPEQCSNVLRANESYKSSVLLGMPVVHAVETEQRSAPFGVAVHESARSFLEVHERARSHTWWPWYTPFVDVARNLRGALSEYFDWCGARAGAIDYDVGRIQAHRRMAQEYFVSV
jgi:hypothetical protein